MRQGGTSDAWGGPPGHRLADAGEKQPILFLTWYPGKSLSRVFCVASARCLYLRRVKRHHQVVKGRDAETFEKFFWGRTSISPSLEKKLPCTYKQYFRLLEFDFFLYFAADFNRTEGSIAFH